MDQEQLAGELRRGHAWRFADGFRVSIGGEYADKTQATDWELMKAASTCSTWGKSAANEEIEEVTADAHDYRSFSTLIAPYIEHAGDCIAEEDDDDFDDDDEGEEQRH